MVQGPGASVGRRIRPGSLARLTLGTMLGLAVLGVPAAVALGAPLVSILVVGLLLLCPLLLWVPFRSGRHPVDHPKEGRADDGTHP
ncbi:MAG: hypothetical protein ACE14W_10670 [Candidatus Velamenicoccus archaeovorus]